VGTVRQAVGQVIPGTDVATVIGDVIYGRIF
jgi:hypothetical protein